MTGRVLAIALISLVLVGIASASSGARVPRFIGCDSGASPASIRPHSILIACADGNYSLGQLKWSEWTTERAKAVGVAHINDCKPDCAAGHFHAYPGIEVWLNRPATCAKQRTLFTRIVWKFTGKKLAFMKKRVAHERAPFAGNAGCPA